MLSIVAHYRLLNLSEIYGFITTGQESLIHDNFKALKLTNTFERTLVVQSIQFGIRACSLIRSSVPLTTYESEFLSPVSGYFAIRQLPQIVTSIRADIFWTNGIQENTEMQWSILKLLQGPEKHFYETSLRQQRTCSYLWELISSDLTVPLFVSESLVNIKVGGGSHPISTTFAVTMNFTSLDTMDMQDIWVVLRLGSDEFVACAPLSTVQPREAIAKFQQLPFVTGFVHFYQPSKYGDATTVTVNLTLPKRNAAGFGIDQLALPAKYGEQQQCTLLSLVYFNPMQNDLQATPKPLVGTTDRYSIGDLSGTMGTLFDLDSLQTTFYNQYLTLYGPKSVIGRSVTLYETTWYPLACSNLHTGSQQLTARAVFKGRVIGSAIFRQDMKDGVGIYAAVQVDIRYRGKSTVSLVFTIKELIATTQ